MRNTPDAKQAAAEFDDWADAGRAESMADGHQGVAFAAIRGWTLDTDDVALDVGCGNGWALRELVARGAGRGLGVDIAPKMIALAREDTADDPRFEFQASPADKLPWPDASASHILNIESLYYYPNPAAALAEWARVAKPGARLAILVDLYEENPATHVWIDALDIAVHLFSTHQLIAMAEAAGWSDVWAEQVLDPRPITPESEFQTSKYWPSYDLYRQHRETGALVIHAKR
jgi:ubiquinone/menaquinone biosynthesis C-methylase UbiE